MADQAEVKTFFIRKGWKEGRSAKYLHNEAEGKKLRVVFLQMAFRVELATPNIGKNRWYNLRSAYYKDVQVGAEHITFKAHNNDIIHEWQISHTNLLQTLL